MDRMIDEALIRATRQATKGPPELRAGRYEPERAECFEAGRPEQRGYVPGKVQGGYQPSTSQHGKPPTGGSAVKPPKK